MPLPFGAAAVAALRPLNAMLNTFDFESVAREARRVKIRRIVGAYFGAWDGLSQHGGLTVGIDSG